MEHYFSTVDPEVYGSGSKMYHNVTGRIGVMFGTKSDLRVGLAWQTIMDGERPYHEAMRPLYIVEDPRDRITVLIQKNAIMLTFAFESNIDFDKMYPTYKGYVRIDLSW